MMMVRRYSRVFASRAQCLVCRRRHSASDLRQPEVSESALKVDGLLCLRGYKDQSKQARVGRHGGSR